MRRTLPLLVLCACAPVEPQPRQPYIAPLDGQTAVAPSVDLLVSTGGLDLPPDYPVDANTIRVVDLDEGGLVKGEVWRDGSDLYFTPKDEWTSGHTYAWTIADTPSDGRQPQHDLPIEVLGDATFRAGDGAAVLDAGVGNLGAICLLLSRAVASVPPDLRMTVNGDPVDGTWEIRDEWAPGRRIKLLAEDAGVKLACLLDAPPVQGGESLRVWWGAEGPWHFPLDFVDAEALAAEERRRVTR